MTVRRLKTYTGSQGFVYQYYFVGKRAAPDGDAAEYIFDVTSDRKHTFSVRVFLPRLVGDGWSGAHGRALSDSEQYAGIKLRLFRAFDEVDDMEAQGRHLQIDLPFLEEALRSLGVD